MTKDDILRMAREAGFAIGPATGAIYAPIICKTELERFATLVAAAEREVCAKLCESLGGASSSWHAEAIRARGEK